MVTHTPLQIAKHYISHEATRNACCHRQCSSCFSVIGVQPHGKRSDVRAREGDQNSYVTEEDYKYHQLVIGSVESVR